MSMPTTPVPRHELPPGPSIPSSLQTLRWVVRPTAFMEESRRRYGDCFTLRIASEGSWVLGSDPESIKKVFIGNPEHLRAGEANVILRPVVGSESVLLLDGPSHMRQRKLLLPPFHGERMQRYGEVMREVTEREIDGWPTGQPFQLWPRMQAVTLEVIMRAVFGLEKGAQLDRLREILRHTLDWATPPAQMFLMAAMVPERLSDMPRFRRALEPVDRELFDLI